MKFVKVVIDNDSLSHLCYIDSKTPVLRHLHFVFNSIHVPDEIFNEFQHDPGKNPERQKVASLLLTVNSFWKKCSDYDSLIKSLLETHKGIDKGEAAVAAQHQRIGARFIISEDKNFIKKLKEIYPFITVIKTKHLLAILDLHKFIDWGKCIKILHQRRKIDSSELRQAYLDAGKLFGFEVNKKTLTQKCSLKARE